MKLIIATHNRDKLIEIRALFEWPGLDVLGADDVHLEEVEEDGDTLEANAIKKAVAAARTTGCWALADDTGLEVDALNGEPGIYSARYSGPDATYASNVALLLKNIEGQANRDARFRTVMALSSPTGETRTVDGACEGTITEIARGEGGFGYDPIFLPKGYHLTFAELDLDAKNGISHRGRALRAARDAWGDMLGSSPEGWA